MKMDFIPSRPVKWQRSPRPRETTWIAVWKNCDEESDTWLTSKSVNVVNSKCFLFSSELAHVKVNPCPNLDPTCTNLPELQLILTATLSQQKNIHCKLEFNRNLQLWGFAVSQPTFWSSWSQHKIRKMKCSGSRGSEVPGTTDMLRGHTA